jgi:hypothetical protein
MADESLIEDFLLQINSLHHTFNEENPITYQVLLVEFGEQLNEEQKEWCRVEMKRLTNKQNAINKKMLEYMDNEISRLPISEKINEHENRCISIFNKDGDKPNTNGSGVALSEIENLVYRLPLGKT